MKKTLRTAIIVILAIASLSISALACRENCGHVGIVNTNRENLRENLYLPTAFFSVGESVTNENKDLAELYFTNLLLGNKIFNNEVAKQNYENGGLEVWPDYIVDCNGIIYWHPVMVHEYVYSVTENGKLIKSDISIHTGVSWNDEVILNNIHTMDREDIGIVLYTDSTTSVVLQNYNKLVIYSFGFVVNEINLPHTYLG